MTQRWEAFKCPGCPQDTPKLWDLELLKQHYARTHMNNFHLYCCPKCQKTFASPLSARHHLLKACMIPEDTDPSEYTVNILKLPKNVIFNFNSAVQTAVKDFTERATAAMVAAAAAAAPVAPVAPPAPLGVDFGVQVSIDEDKMMLNTYTQTDEMSPFHETLSTMKMDDMDTSSSTGGMSLGHYKTPPMTPGAQFMLNWETMTRTSGSSTSSRLALLDEKPKPETEENPEAKAEEKPMSHFELKPMSRDPRLLKRSIDASSSTPSSPAETSATSGIPTENVAKIRKIEEPHSNASAENHSSSSKICEFDGPRMMQLVKELLAANEGTGSKEIDVRPRSVGGEHHRANSSASTSCSPKTPGGASHDNAPAARKEAIYANGRERLDPFDIFRLLPLERSKPRSFKQLRDRKCWERDEREAAMKKKRRQSSEDMNRSRPKTPSNLKTKRTNGIIPGFGDDLPPFSPFAMDTNSNNVTPKTPESPPIPPSISDPEEEEPYSPTSNHQQHFQFPRSSSRISPSSAPPRFSSRLASDSNTIDLSPPIPSEETNLIGPIPPPPDFGRPHHSSPPDLPPTEAFPHPQLNFFVPPPSVEQTISSKEEEIRTDFLIETDAKDACIQFTASTNKKIKKMYFESKFLANVSSVFERQLREYPRDAQKVIKINHGSHSFTDAMVMLISPDFMFSLGCQTDKGEIGNESRLLRMLTASEEFGLSDVKIAVQKKLFADMCFSVHGSDCIHCIDRVAIAKRYQLHIPEQVKFTHSATTLWSIKSNNEDSLARRLKVVDKVFRFLRPLF